jgi:nucleoside-diphosphate-sugar epimerase
MSVRNLCDLLLRVTRAPEARGLCLLAADAEITSVSELVRSIRAADGRAPRLFRLPPRWVSLALRIAGRGRDVPGLIMPFVVRASAALSALGWVPPHHLEDEIRWTVASGCSRSGLA